MDAAHVIGLLERDAWSMTILRAVRAIDLPDWAIGAGFVRNRVWDRVFGKSSPTRPGDIDVLYYDARDLRAEVESAVEATLRSAIPRLVWSVTNQARMYVENGDPPYVSTEDAIGYWLETPTCVAVRLHADDRLELLAPHGIDDLVAGVVRPTPNGRRRLAAYERRIAGKKEGWISAWPGLRFEW